MKKVRNMNLVIVGNGFVGQAVHKSFENVADVSVRIVDPEYSTFTIVDACAGADVFFLCLPTPTKINGSCDFSLVERAIITINDKTEDALIIVKSTIPPDDIHHLETMSKMPLVYIPEFLRQESSFEDYLSPQMQVIGGAQTAVAQSIQILNKSKCNKCPVYKTDVKTASLAKYAINSYLASKVVFMNELRDLHVAADTGTSFDYLTRIINADKRIGTSHMQVPGPDGEYGYGGECLPKDVNALLKYAKIMNVDLSMIQTANDTNKKIKRS